MKTPSLAEWLKAVESLDYYTGNSDADYLKAVYEFASEFALGNWDDPEHILSIAEGCYAGNFASTENYGEWVAENYLSDRLDALYAAANGTSEVPGIPFTIDWEQFAEQVLPNTYGWNYSFYNDGEPGTGAHYFREPA